MHYLALLLQVVNDTASAWGAVFAGVGALGTSFVLAQVKKTDFAIAKSPFFRKIQPALTLGGALLAPWVASHASSGVDVSGFGAAPAATLGTVIAAELLAMLKRST
jgi:hypothetical protein